MLVKRQDINALLPAYLDAKPQSRTAVKLVTDENTAYVIGTYQDAGSYVIASLSTKKQLRVQKDKPLKSLQWWAPYVITLHEDKNESGSLELYDVEQQRSATIYKWKDTSGSLKIAFAGEDGIIALGTNTLYKFKYKMQKQDPLKIALLGNDVQTPVPRLCSLAGNYLLLASNRTCQIWDAAAGTLIMSCAVNQKSSNSTFLITQFNGTSFAACTIGEIYLWQVGRPGCSVLPQEITPCAIVLEGDLAYVGNLKGQISVYSTSAGRHLYDLNKVDSDQKGKSLVSQIQSKVNLMRIFNDFIFVAFETGDVHVYHKNAQDQIEPIKETSVHGRVLAWGRTPKHILLHINKPDKKVDEIMFLPARMLKVLKTLRSMARRFGNEDVDYGEDVVKSGVLVVVVERPGGSEKPRKRYCVLRANGIIYLFKSANDTTPQDMLMLRSSSHVKTTKQKRNAFSVQLHNNQVARLTAHDQDEAESWIDAISSTLKEMALQDIFQVDHSELVFETSPSGENVVLGKGSFSTVVKATYNKQPVAVKIFKTDSFVNSEEFRNEILILSAVKHPCILPLVGVTKPPNVAVVTPYIENGSLFDFLHKNKLDEAKYTWRVLLKVAFDIASAMHYLHTFRMNGVRTPIIHADLKSPNVMLTNLSSGLFQPSIQLIDFGLSMHRRSAMNESKRQGTVAYMAPEMLRGEGKYSSGVDVYSYGVLLWEMFTKSIPYAKSTAKTIETMVLSGSRLPIPSYVPVQLATLVQDCWKQNPSDRPSFAEITNRLIAVIADMLADGIIDTPVINTESDKPRSRSNTSLGELPKHKLYGRKKELTKLMKTLMQFASTGSSEIVFVHGNAGVGLTNIVQRALLNWGRASCAAIGEYTREDRAPYSGLQQALRSCFRATLDVAPKESLQAWKNRIIYTFDNSELASICTLVPEIAEFLGRPLEEIMKHGTNVGVERFQCTFGKMLKISTYDYPLVIVLKDLQWADTLSYQILAKLFTSDQKPRVLVIATYRDNEVTESHPLHTLLKSKLDQSKVTDITLKPLDKHDIQEMVMDNFPSLPEQQAEQMANVILDRSMGLPFFVRQLMQNITPNMIETVDGKKRLSGMISPELMSATADTLIERSISAIPADLLSVLLISSFMTNTICVSTLARLMKKISVTVNQSDVTITPIEGKQSPALTRSAIETLCEDAIKRKIFRHSGKYYYFVDDTMKEALNAKVTDEALRKTIHFHIGRAKLSQIMATKEEPPLGELYETVRHVNLALEQFKDSKYRNQAAKLNIRTAKSAAAVADFEASITYAKAARKLLPDRESASAEELELHWEAILIMNWVAFIANNVEVAIMTSKELTELANTPFKQAVALRAQIAATEASVGDTKGIIEPALQALKLVGVDTAGITAAHIFSNPDCADKLIAEVNAMMKGDPLYLANRAPPNDPATSSTEVSAFIAELFILIFTPIGIMGDYNSLGSFIHIWFKYLISNPTLNVPLPALYYYGLWLANSKYEFGTAHKLWDIAYQRIEAQPNEQFRSHLYVMLVESYFPRIFSWKKLRRLVKKVEQTAIEEGDQFALMRTSSFYSIVQLFTSPLSTVLEALSSFVSAIPIKHPLREVAVANYNMVQQLRGENTIKSEGKVENVIIHNMQTMIQIEAATLLGDYTEAMNMLKAMWAKSTHKLKPGDFTTLLFAITSCVTQIYQLRTEKDPAFREELITQSQLTIAFLSGGDMGSKNSVPFVKFLETEMELANALYECRSKGDGDDCLDDVTVLKFVVRYGEVVQLTERLRLYNGVYLWMTGLCNERCAELCKQQGFTTLENFFVEEAIKRYEQWGSKALVKKLRTRGTRTSMSGTGISSRTSSMASLTIMDSTTSQGARSSSAMEDALPHIQYAKTIARGLPTHYAQISQNDRSFEQLLLLFQSYMSTQIPDDVSIVEEDNADSSEASDSLSEHSPLSSMKDERVNFSEIIEASTATASHYMRSNVASSPSVMCYIPPTGCPNYVVNGSQLRDLVTHVLLSFVSYTSKNLAVVVFCDKSSTKQYQVKLQISSFIPESVDNPVSLAPATSVPSTLSTMLKYCDQWMETFHTQMSYQYDTKTHDAVLIVTLSVTVTPQVGLFFKNRTTKDVVVKYLHAMGVDYVFVNMDANSVSGVKMLVIDELPNNISNLKLSPDCVTYFVGSKSPAPSGVSLTINYVPLASLRSTLQKAVQTVLC